jgi:hypothetical protein
MTQTLWITISFAMMLAAVAVLTHDLAQELQCRRVYALQAGVTRAASLPVKYRTAAAFATLAWIPVMLGLALMFSAS